MAVTQFKCPNNVPTFGNVNNFDYCLYKCDNRCMPRGVLIKMVEWLTSNPHVGDYVSPTTILYCMRQTFWARIEDYAEEPTRLWGAFRGERFHDLFNVPEGVVEGFHSEKEMSKVFTGPRCGSVEIFGRKDVHDTTNKTIEDYKSMVDMYLTYRKKDGATKECTYQLNIYAWMSDWVDVEKLVAHYIGMGEIVTTGKPSAIQAWRKDKPKDKLDNLIKIEATGRKRESGSKNKSVQKEYLMWVRVPEVPIIEEDALMEFMDQRIYLWQRAFKENAVPPLLNIEEYEWLCPICPFLEKCTKYEQENSI